MKKGFVVLFFIIVAAAATAYGTFSGNNGYTDYNYDVDADYYGCPNSKRVHKLNLKKKRRSM